MICSICGVEGQRGAYEEVEMTFKILKGAEFRLLSINFTCSEQEVGSRVKPLANPESGLNRRDDVAGGTP